MNDYKKDLVLRVYELLDNGEDCYKPPSNQSLGETLYIISQLKPLDLPTCYVHRQGDGGIYLQWETGKRCVILRIDALSSLDNNMYYVDDNEEDYFIKNPTVDKINEILEWLSQDKTPVEQVELYGIVELQDGTTQRLHYTDFPAFIEEHRGNIVRKQLVR